MKVKKPETKGEKWERLTNQLNQIISEIDTSIITGIEVSVRIGNNYIRISYEPDFFSAEKKI